MDSKGIGLRDYISVIIRHKKWIFLGVLIPVLAAAAFYLVIPGRYEARAIIYLLEPKLKTELGAEPVAVIQPSQSISTLSTTFDRRIVVSKKACELMLKGQDVLLEIKNRLKLGGMTLRQLDEMLEVEMAEESKSYYRTQLAPVFTLTAKVKNDRDLASSIANTWAELFIAKYNAITKKEMEEIYEYILTEYQRAKRNLKQAEAALVRFEAAAGEKQGPIERKVQLLSLKRDVESSKDTYNLFHQKLNQVKVSVMERSPRAIIMSRAVKPQEKAGPPMALVLLFAGVCGFILSLLFCFVATAKNDAKA